MTEWRILGPHKGQGRVKKW